MPVKRGFELWSSSKSTFSVELWLQPWHWWLASQLYHWYDMRIWRVPGVRRLERWLTNRSQDLDYIPLTNRQDLRCYELSRKKKVSLATLDIPKEVYEALKQGR